MSLFCNDYQKIKEDNLDAIAKISVENKKTVERMFRYISSFSVSMFELEVIKKDIIGIALEADAEDIDIEEKLGCSEKEFCDSLIQDGMGHNWWEKWLLKINKFILYLFVLYSIDFAVLDFSDEAGIDIRTIMLALTVSIISEMMDQYVIRKGEYQGKKTRNWVKAFIVLIVFSSLIGSLSKSFGSMLFYGHGRIVWGIVTVIALIFFLGNNLYWNHCSKKYDWK